MMACHLTLVTTHRAVSLPDEWRSEHLAYAEELQREDYEPRVYTGDEVRFAFFLGGFAGCMVTVALAFCWSFWL